MARVIMHRGQVLETLKEGEEWHAIGDRVVIVHPDKPRTERELPVPDGDIAGLVEGFTGGA